MSSARRTAGFILVHYHAPEITLRALRSIGQHKSSIKSLAYVVDNGSTPQERSILEAGLKQLDLKVVLSPRQPNIGYAGAINYAAGKIKADYLAIVNNDAELLPGWLDRLTRHLETDPEIGLVGGVEVDDAGVEHLPPYLVLKNLTTTQREDAQITEPVEFVSGSNMLLRLSDFKPWRSSYFLYYEDIAACLAVWRGGQRVELVRSARVHHQANTTTQSIPIKKGVYATRNRYRLGYEYLSRSELAQLWLQGIKGDVLGSSLRLLTLPLRALILLSGKSSQTLRETYVTSLGRLIGFGSALAHLGEFQAERADYQSAWSLAKLLDSLHNT